MFINRQAVAEEQDVKAKHDPAFQSRVGLGQRPGLSHPCPGAAAGPEYGGVWFRGVFPSDS